MKIKLIYNDVHKVLFRVVNNVSHVNDDNLYIKITYYKMFLTMKRNDDVVLKNMIDNINFYNYSWFCVWEYLEKWFYFINISWMNCYFRWYKQRIEDFLGHVEGPFIISRIGAIKCPKRIIWKVHIVNQLNMK